MGLKLKQRIKIENATHFKLEYYAGSDKLKTREFKSVKLMEQFNARQTDFMYMPLNRYALINDKWHRFMKLPSDIVFEQDVKRIVEQFNDVPKSKDFKKYKSED